jgi:hypothetical protein
MRTTNILCLLGLAVALGQACQNAAPKQAEAPAFTATPYWVSSSFVKALEANSDTLVTSQCHELQFIGQDSVVYIYDGVEAAPGTYTVIDDKTIEISGEMFGDAVLRVTQISDQEIVMDQGTENEVRFQPVENHEHDPRGAAALLLGQHLAGTYTRENPFGRTNAAQPITLNADGTVKGFEAYQHYEAPLGGDLAAAEDLNNMIYFSAEGQEMFPLVWSKRGDTLNLWTVENMSEADEKPFYAVGRMYDRLIKKK